MNVLSILFLIAFIAGLVLAVIAMLHGVEHTRSGRTRAPSPFFNVPALAAFAIAFGAVGYPLATRTHLAAWGTIAIAAASGAAAIAGMITLLARWALRGKSSEWQMDDHEIQGQLAIVTRNIAAEVPGEIAYEMLGRKVRVPAREISAKDLTAGVEVVIDRIENGVAFVEEWAAVEQRI